jgi:3-hydroxy-9,10-secoandrosta-1,3,5(10)-triene-9,17-dione monooxygenase
VWSLPQADYEIIDTWHVPGLRGTGSHDIVVKDAFVPDYRVQAMADNYLGRGPGQAVNTAPLYRQPFGQVFVRGISTSAVGALKGMLDAFIAFGRARMSRAHGRAQDNPTIQLLCAEVALGIDEMKTMLHANFGVLADYAARGEMPPVPLRQQFKFQSAWVGERCSLLAARLFKATEATGLMPDLPFARFNADIQTGRQHLSNQFEAYGRNWGAALLGAEDNKDLML